MEGLKGKETGPTTNQGTVAPSNNEPEHVSTIQASQEETAQLTATGTLPAAMATDAPMVGSAQTSTHFELDDAETGIPGYVPNEPDTPFQWSSNVTLRPHQRNWGILPPLPASNVPGTPYFALHNQSYYDDSFRTLQESGPQSTLFDLLGNQIGTTRPAATATQPETGNEASGAQIVAENGQHESQQQTAELTAQLQHLTREMARLQARLAEAERTVPHEQQSTGVATVSTAMMVQGTPAPVNRAPTAALSSVTTVAPNASTQASSSNVQSVLAHPLLTSGRVQGLQLPGSVQANQQPQAPPHQPAGPQQGLAQGSRTPAPPPPPVGGWNDPRFSYPFGPHPYAYNPYAPYPSHLAQNPYGPNPQGQNLFTQQYPQPPNRLPRTTIPPIKKTCIDMWFTQLDTWFQVNKVTNEVDKFNLVVPTLEGDQLLDQIDDAVTNPPAGAEFANLKAAIKKHYSDSEQQKLQKLMAGYQLGDLKPSHLLTKINKQCDQVSLKNSPMVRQIWFNSLPGNLQTAMAAAMAIAQPDTPLQKLAETADKIMEQTGSGKINAVTHREKSRSPERRGNSDIEKVLERIEKMEGLLNKLSTSRGRSNSKGRGGSREKSRSPSKSTDDPNKCFYHNRFGDKAYKCKPDCTENASFKKRQGASKND